MHKVLIKNYDKLISILNSSVLNLSKHFVAKNIITIEDEEEIRKADRDKARLFLVKIEAPVKGGFTAGFHIMLDVMFQYGSVTDRQLAEQIRNEIDEECKNGRCIYMCTCVSIVTRPAKINSVSVKNRHFCLCSIITCHLTIYTTKTKCLLLRWHRTVHVWLHHKIFNAYFSKSTINNLFLCACIYKVLLYLSSPANQIVQLCVKRKLEILGV